ncbi:unnamed protein product, partial [Rotaria magnacalcarata]
MSRSFTNSKLKVVLRRERRQKQRELIKNIIDCHFEDDDSINNDNENNNTLYEDTSSITIDDTEGFHS